MKYMLLIYGDENALDRGRARELLRRVDRSSPTSCTPRASTWRASPLHPVATATSVRVRGGKRLVTDGPFAETREQLGGYFLVEAKDLDEAIAIAAPDPRRPQGDGGDPAGAGAGGFAVGRATAVLWAE